MNKGAPLHALLDFTRMRCQASVVKYFDKIQVSLDNLIMFTSDRASVMLGCDNGVQAKLKSVVPHLIEFHCVAHREALSVNQAYQSVSYFVQIQSMLHAIYLLKCMN